MYSEIKVGQKYKCAFNSDILDIKSIVNNPKDVEYARYEKHAEGFLFESMPLIALKLSIENGTYILLNEDKEFFDENVNRLALVIED